MDNLIDMYEAGKMLGVDYQTIRSYIKKGKLKMYKLGYKTVRVDKGEVIKIMEEACQKINISDSGTKS